MLYLALISFSSLLVSKSSSYATISWWYRGSNIQANTSASLNVGDSFLLRCKATTSQATIDGLAPMFVLIFASQSSTANPKVTLTYARGSSPTNMDATITSTAGTIIYDSFNGCQSTWSHWLVSDKSSMGNNAAATTRAVSTSWLSIFVPKLISTDAGTIYCTYSDGSSILASNILFSSAFTLSLTTKSNANHIFKQPSVIDYSLLILSASSSLTFFI